MIIFEQKSINLRVLNLYQMYLNIAIYGATSDAN